MCGKSKFLSHIDHKRSCFDLRNGQQGVCYVVGLWLNWCVCAPASFHVQTHDILLPLGWCGAVNGTRSSQLFCPTRWTDLCERPPGQNIWLVYRTGWMTSASEDSVVKWHTGGHRFSEWWQKQNSILCFWFRLVWPLLLVLHTWHQKLRTRPASFPLETQTHRFAVDLAPEPQNRMISNFIWLWRRPWNGQRRLPESQ